jgi:hypothetical protein
MPTAKLIFRKSLSARAEFVQLTWFDAKYAMAAMNKTMSMA